MNKSLIYENYELKGNECYVIELLGRKKVAGFIGDL